MSQGSKKKKGMALVLVLLLVMSALAVVVFGKGYIRNKNRGVSSHIITASSAEQIAERIISENISCRRRKTSKRASRQLLRRACRNYREFRGIQKLIGIVG